MIRKIIKINEEKCNGCGLCVTACHEGAIGLVDGKARLLREDYCDGLGDCLPACPMQAISFEEREAPAYNEAAVLQAKARKGGGCPGQQPQVLRPKARVLPAKAGAVPSQLRNWPVQIRLAPVQSAIYDQADLLIAADCTAFSYGNFHREFLQGRVALVGCPKLDPVDYSEKLTEIFARNDIRSLTVVRMEVPCCGGLTKAIDRALARCGRDIPCKSVVISTDGRLL